MNRFLQATGVIVLAGAAAQALRIGYADRLFRQDSSASIERAAQLWPRDGPYLARLADFNSSDAVANLRRAVALNPGRSQTWIQLGLRMELQGDVAEAERCYLEAARHDRQFLPAWTLANFYARRKDAERFWPWARHAAETSYADIAPLVRLAFEFTKSPETVLERMIPPRPRVEREFLAYLLDHNLDGSSAAARLLASGDPQGISTLLAWIDRLLESGRILEARRAWDALSDRGFIPYPHLGLLTNADFSHEPLGAGFDWHMKAPSGVTYARTARGLEVQFSGRQPETFELASQQLALAPGRRHLLSLEYRTTDLAGPTNLRWRAGQANSAPLGSSEEWTPWSWAFCSTHGTRLALVENRELGTTRPEGTVVVRGLSLSTLGESCPAAK